MYTEVYKSVQKCTHVFTVRCTQVYSLFFVFSLFLGCYCETFPLNRYTLHTSLHIAPYTPHPHPTPRTIHPLYGKVDPDRKRAVSVSAHDSCLLHLKWAPFTPPPHHTPIIRKGRSWQKESSFSKCTWQLLITSSYAHPTRHTSTLHPLLRKVRSWQKESSFSKCTWQLLITPHMHTLHPTAAPWHPAPFTPLIRESRCDWLEREQLK